MKTNGNHLVLFFLLLGIAMTGCEKEIIEPTSSSIQPSLRSGIGLNAPDQQCGSTRYAELSDGSTSMGSVQIMNDANDIYLLMEMFPNFFIENLFVYYGTTSNIPVNGNGDIVTEDFQVQTSIPNGAAKYTVSYPKANLPTCLDLVVLVVASEKNMFGNTTDLHYLWLDGTPTHNGYSFKYCVQSCNTSI